jgi:DNA-binding CsgD family transcriptional regulator
MRATTRLMIERLTSLASEGKTYQEAADILGISYASVFKYAARYGAPLRQLKRGRSSTGPGKREEEMCSLFLEGKTFAEIGNIFGLTRQRIMQLLKKTYGVWGPDGGVSIRVRAAREKLEKRRAAYAMQHFDLPYEEYRRVLKLPGQPTRKYASQRNGAFKRNIAWELTFAQWWKIWQQSGHWDQRGHGANRYCMCRLGDVGPYAVDNVYIATNSENIRDGWLNRGAETAT